MKIHIVIVSEQTLANLIPILIDRPDKVLVVTSDDMKTRKLDNRLISVLKR